MTTLTVAAASAIGFIVSIIILIMTTETTLLRGRTLKRLSIAVLILGTFVLGTACSTTYLGTTKSGKPVGYVKRAVFTTKIKDREPTNNIKKLDNNRQKIYYFTDLRGMKGQKVKHRWVYKGKVRAEVSFKVNGQRWRVYSSKTLNRGWLGDWTVSTVDRYGRTLSRNSFTYSKARGFFGRSTPTKAPAKARSKAGSKESYLDKGARKASEFYKELFGDD